MRIIFGLYLFYIKVFIPAILVAVILTMLDFALTTTFSLYITGFSYFFLAMGFQFILYELSNPGQYYFYYNLGLNKRQLWIFSMSISFILAMILSII